MSTPESKATQSVRLRASDWGIRLFRNNSGVLINEVGVPVRFGLGNESKKLNQELKSGDLVGWTPMTITPDMVGKTVAVFTNIEAKAEGFSPKISYNPKSREYGQDKFNNLVNNAGGVAGFATNQVDFDRLINECVARFTKNEN